MRVVCQLAQHYHKSRDLVTEEELRQYFPHIKNVKKYSRAASTIPIKFFYEKTLGREFTTLKLVRAPREKKLPVILSLGFVCDGHKVSKRLGRLTLLGIHHATLTTAGLWLDRAIN